MLHTIQPDLPMFVLVDYDPYGVAILRTYKYGSQRLAHESSATVPGIQWLGVRSRDVLTSSFAVNSQNSQDADSQSSGVNSSQESMALSFDGQLSEDRPRVKRARLSKSRNPSESVAPLTLNDRKKAVSVLKEICDAEEIEDDEKIQILELQRMLMLNFKAEIQALDDFGDIARWLDEKL